MPLIYPPQDPRRRDSRLFKGGDGGAAQMRQDEVDRQGRVQQAVDAINSRFGVAPTSQVKAPSREQFTTSATEPTSYFNGDTDVWVPAQVERFDQAGFDRAMAQFSAGQTSAQAGSAAADEARKVRESMYSDISGAVTQTALVDLDRQYEKAHLQNRYRLSRNGQRGSSVDAESNGELATLYGEGKLRAAQLGQQASADLRSTDERARQNLISLAQSGMDTGTAQSMAAGQMSAAAELARNQTGQASVGRLFDDLTAAYVGNQVMRARYPNGLPGQNQSPYRYEAITGSHAGNIQNN